MFLIVLKVLDAPEGLDIDMERNVSVARIRQDNDGETLIYLQFYMYMYIIVEKTLNQKSIIIDSIRILYSIQYSISCVCY